MEHNFNRIIMNATVRYFRRSSIKYDDIIVDIKLNFTRYINDMFCEIILKDYTEFHINSKNIFITTHQLK